MKLRFKYNDGGRAAAGFRGSTGDCVCRSIAIATGLKYQVVYQHINNIGSMEKIAKRQRGKSHARTGVYKSTQHALLAKLGWRWVPTMGIGTGCKVHLRQGEVPMKGTIICKVSRHLVTVVDGVMYDTHDPSRGGSRCVYGYWIKN